MFELRTWARRDDASQQVSGAENERMLEETCDSQRCIILAYFQHPFCTPLAYLRLHPWRYFHYFKKDPGANVRHPDTWRRPNEQQESACVKYIYNRRVDCETQLGCAALHCRLTTAQVSFMLFKNTIMGAYLAWSVCISFVMQTTSRFDVGSQIWCSMILNDPRISNAFFALLLALWEPWCLPKLLLELQQVHVLHRQVWVWSVWRFTAFSLPFQDVFTVFSWCFNRDNRAYIMILIA